jgi:hypothetical protein
MSGDPSVPSVCYTNDSPAFAFAAKQIPFQRNAPPADTAAPRLLPTSAKSLSNFLGNQSNRQSQRQGQPRNATNPV